MNEARELQQEPEQRQVYRVQGFSCAGCAAKFEKNVKELDQVLDAKVNFGASKLTVIGNSSITELERAGAFEGLRIYPEETRLEQMKQTDSYFKRYGAVMISAVFLALAWYLQYVLGEQSSWTIAAFAAAILTGGTGLFIEGIKNLAKLHFDMTALMTAAIIGAALIGEWSEGAVVVILFAISEVLERYSMDRARRSIQSLMEIAPKEALVRRNGKEFMLPVEDVEPGDVILIKPGQKIALDGKVIQGSSAINQAAITGESVPVEKHEGDEVFAGTLNTEGFLEIRVTKQAKDTTLAKIIHLVEEAQGERAPSQAFIDKFARIYTPAIMLIALLTATVPPLFTGNWSEWIYQGLAVLVVGCPCALVISTPVAIVTAIGNAAGNGVLIKGGVHLEELGRIKAIAFDKTGTLTKGVPALTDFITLDKARNENEWLALIAALEHRSQHPLAAAITKEADRRNIEYRNISGEEIQSLTGKGIAGKIAGLQLQVGSPALFGDCSHFPVISPKVLELQEQGKTVMLAGIDGNTAAILAVADEVRETTGEVIRRLHGMGIEKTIMLTGDNASTAAAIGRQAGVGEVYSELMPSGKLDFIKKLNQKYGSAAMVGDGVNDAPALAAASVGVAMGGAGTDTALETADIALMGDDLKKLPFTIKLSRRTLGVIKQNITFSLAIKLLALLLVVPGWLTLWIAIFADMGATLIVTLNGLRLLRIKDK
ncbi:heavy metal translocating P-type ATPase [Peribacillus sp. SCS-37]|uniref:heavy metal translocating P-type ATPase n=1 Tax=Paraperibacillus esterisolvens TaxID=3115296 RepID=UPI003906A45E